MFNVLLVERLKRHVINQKNFNSSLELARQMTSVATVQFCQNKHWVKTNRSPLDLLNTVVGLIFPRGDDQCPAGRVFQYRVGSGRILDKIPGNG